MKKKNKKKTWIKKRHSIFRNVLYAILYPYSKIVYGFSVEKFKEEEDRPYLVLFNHQTAFDQFFVGMAFKKTIYYVASEDLFTKGFVSSAIKYVVAPIPIKKQSTDLGAILNCVRVSKEGGSIAIAPEGNRTYSGKTGYMSDSIAVLAKKLKLPIALYRIEGGYGVQPRWSDKVRKGKMRGYVAKVIKPEEYATMTDKELFDVIESTLYVDEGIDSGTFKHKKRAEYLERAMYVCPKCGLSTFYSHNHTITCQKCGLEVDYGIDKRLTSFDKDFNFEFVSGWYDYQCNYVNSLNLLENTSEPYYNDQAKMFSVIPSKRKTLISKNVNLALYGDKITVNGKTANFVLNFEDVSTVTVLGKNKLNVYYKDDVYQFKGDKRFNALKYVNFFFRYKNIIKGEENGKFLGI